MFTNTRLLAGLVALMFTSACQTTRIEWVLYGGGEMTVAMAPVGNDGVQFEVTEPGATEAELLGSGGDSQEYVRCPPPAMATGTYDGEDMVPVIEFCAMDVAVTGNSTCATPAVVNLELDDVDLTLWTDDVEQPPVEDGFLIAGHEVSPTMNPSGSLSTTVTVLADCVGDFEGIEHTVDITWDFDVTVDRTEKDTQSLLPPWDFGS